jgi:hypothetical protein
MRHALLLFLTSGCGAQVCWFGTCVGDGVDDPTQPTTATTTDPSACADSEATWEAFTQPFLTTWCTPCHSSELTGSWRLGAPLGANFDTHADAAQWADSIVAYAASDEPLMPPAGGTTLDEQAMLREWAACGAPGSSPQPDACDTRIPVDGDLTVSTVEEAEAICVSGNTITGSLTVLGGASEPLSCLCEVEGSLILEGTGLQSLVLPSLSAIGGDLRVATNPSLEALALPELTQISGGLYLENNTSLHTIELSVFAELGGDFEVINDGARGDLEPRTLVSIGGHLTVADNPGLTRLSLTRVREVLGSWQVSENATLVEIDQLNTIEQIGGDLIVQANPALQGLDGFRNLVSVGGAMIVDDNDAITILNGFNWLVEAPGGLEITGNEALIDVKGFHVLQTLAGSGLWILDNPSLEEFTALDVLLEIPGDLELRGNGIERLGGLSKLEHIGGNLILDDNRRLNAINALKQLRTVDGDLLFKHNPAMVALELRVDVVGGEIDIAENVGLERLKEWSYLTEAGGLRVADNPALTSLQGLVTLSTVHGTVQLLNQRALEDVTGLGGLVTVGDHLLIQSNRGLTDLRSLGHVESVGADLRIQDNRDLPTSRAEALVETIGEDHIGGTITIVGNGDG